MSADPLLVYPDSVMTGPALASFSTCRLDASREFLRIGAANIGAGFLDGLGVSGSQSTSFVLGDAGANSQVAHLWAAAFDLPL